MRLITIEVPDDGESPIVHTGGVPVRLAAALCYDAHVALDAELPEMQVDRTTPQDWTAS